MHFTKRQREIIQKIQRGEVWDIATFVNAFQPRRIAAYDWEQVRRSFSEDPEAVTHYCAGTLQPTPANLIREAVFEERRRQGQVDAEAYVPYVPELEKTCACQEEGLWDQCFSFDFYQGVRIMDSFDRLVEFLALWQYLLAHALVLEVSQPLTAGTVGLFFHLEAAEAPPPFAADRETGELRFSDQRYLTEGVYRLSRERLEICRSFLGRRLYPAPGLSAFIRNGFRTEETRMQEQALRAAWVGIAVAILIGLAPYLLPLLSGGTASEELAEIPQTVEKMSSDREGEAGRPRPIGKDCDFSKIII